MVSSVIKALNVLELFTPQKPVLTLNEIAGHLGYPKSTVHSMLATLASRGYVEKTAANSYALGRRLIPMTQAVLVNAELRDRAAPLLRELGDTTGQSVYLTVIDGNLSLYIYAIETSHRLLARSAVGDQAPMHCTAVGKAALAFLPADRQDRILSEVGLPRFTEHTITERATLEEELMVTRNRGYSVDNQEHEMQSFCIGAPIFDSAGDVTASCSISGHEESVIGEKLEYYAPKVKYTAQEISRRMGYVPARSEQIWNDVAAPAR
jgi:DNA-binding IclR family transcriptional regulator